MLARPLDDLEGRLLGEAVGGLERAQERHMELLAPLRLGHQACEDNELDHHATPLLQSPLPSGYAIMTAQGSRGHERLRHPELRS
jgi:hypothetical protein